MLHVKQNIFFSKRLGTVLQIMKIGNNILSEIFSLKTVNSYNKLAIKTKIVFSKAGKKLSYVKILTFLFATVKYIKYCIIICRCVLGNR